MNGLLNQSTSTVHRRRGDREALTAICGATAHVSADHLRETTVTDALDDEADKCGRCFDDGGGY